MLARNKGFTLIELMIVVTIIGILSAIAVPKFAQMIHKSREGKTRGNLAALRSSINVYYADTEGIYPKDNLTVLNGKYMNSTPEVHAAGHHGNTMSVFNNDDLGMAGLVLADNGAWSYWNWEGSTFGGRVWGDLWVGCTHTDTKGNVWNTN